MLLDIIMMILDQRYMELLAILVRCHYLKKKNFLEFLTPKFLLRYAPGEMRDVDKNVRLNPTNIFSLDRTNELDIVETGLSAALGFEYEKNFKEGQNN